LRVTGDISAGVQPGAPVAAGTAKRIMTGAPLPAGADAIVPVEDTDEWPRADGAPLPEAVAVRRAVAPGDYVRPAGQDVRAGEVVLAAGRVLRAADIGVLAALGRARVRVRRRPRVAILSTGDELVPVESRTGPAQIRNSNSYALAALVREAWGEPLDMGIARDDAQEVRARLRAAQAAGADLLLSSAGVSVGTRDVIREVLAEEGALDFWRVNVRPGKPLAFGHYGGLPFVGLPGNPVSAMVTFELLVRPALLKMGGRSGAERPRVAATLVAPLTSDGRESYLRAVVTRTAHGYQAELTGDQGSAIMTSLVKANALLVVPAGVRRRRAGTAGDLVGAGRVIIRKPLPPRVARGIGNDHPVIGLALLHAAFERAGENVFLFAALGGARLAFAVAAALLPLPVPMAWRMASSMAVGATSSTSASASGSSFVPRMVKSIWRLRRSISRTLTCTSSPSLRISEASLTYSPAPISRTCSKPGRSAPTSTNAPKRSRRTTLPVKTWPRRICSHDTAGGSTRLRLMRWRSGSTAVTHTVTS
jgi:molybdopterin molybdotransferase